MVATIAFTGCSASIATVGSIDSANNGKKVTAEASSTNWLALTSMSAEKAEEVFLKQKVFYVIQNMIDNINEYIRLQE